MVSIFLVTVHVGRYEDTQTLHTKAFGDKQTAEYSAQNLTKDIAKYLGKCEAFDTLIEAWRDANQELSDKDSEAYCNKFEEYHAYMRKTLSLETSPVKDMCESFASEHFHVSVQEIPFNG